jgi:hypothetical protein
MSEPQEREERQCLQAGLLLSGVTGRREYSVRFIRAGKIRAAGNKVSNVEIPDIPIKMAINAGMLNGRASFVDHAGWFDYPSIRNLAGVTLDAAWNEEDQSADGKIRLYDGPLADALAAVLDSMLQDAEAGEPVPDVGLSLVFWPRWKPRDNREDPLVLSEFRHIESVDFVFEPAADGRIKAALSAANIGMVGGPQPAETFSTQQEVLSMSDELITTPNEPAAPAPAVDPGPQEQDSQAQAWVNSLSATAASVMIANSGLPQVSRDRLASMQFSSPDQVTAAIEAERDYLARLNEDSVIQIGGQAPRSTRIQMGMTGLEQVEAALDAMLSGVRPRDGIKPLSGVRELYNLLSGDYEMRGIFQSERVYLANVNSSTMAGLVANAMNKRLINLFQEYPQWWGPAVTIEDFNSLQDVRWITLGGVGELPTVSEGAAYTELTWDDQTETDSFVKKGGYLGLTIEAIDKDDTGKLRAAPRALAQAAWLTLGKAISAIFTDSSGVGPTMSDSVALFNLASHGNLGSSALAPASWRATKIAMMKQTEVNSGERLGVLTRPYLLWVPVDLEDYAAEILGSDGMPDIADNNVNPDAEGETRTARLQNARKRIIACPLWTDTDNWAAQADPRLYPSIGLGYRYGRTPEIFSVASPTAGLMFTNDTLPVKVRYFFAVGPTDYRGLYKHNV